MLQHSGGAYNSTMTETTHSQSTFSETAYTSRVFSLETMTVPGGDETILPYMHARDVAYMVDNCSRTARLGARRWGPRFQSAYEQIAYPASEFPADEELLRAFDTHPVHEALSSAAKLRPSVDISVA